MKNLNIRFTDAEFRKLKTAKKLRAVKTLTWENFILSACTKGVSEKRKPIRHEKIKSQGVN